MSHPRWHRGKPLSSEELDCLHAVAECREGVAALGLGNGAIVFLGLANGNELGRLCFPTATMVESVAFAAGRRYVVGGTTNSIIRRWSMSPDPDVTSVKGSLEHVEALTPLGDGARIAVGLHNADKSRTISCLSIRRTKTLDALTEAPPELGGISGVAASTDGASLLTTGAHGIVRSWRTHPLEVAWSARLHGLVSHVALTPDGTLAAAYVWIPARTGYLILLDGATGRIRARLNTTLNVSCTALSFTPDGTRLLLVDASSGQARLFDNERLLAEPTDSSLDGAGLCSATLSEPVPGARAAFLDPWTLMVVATRALRVIAVPDLTVVQRIPAPLCASAACSGVPD